MAAVARPINAMRRNHAEYGPFIVISDLAPFSSKLKLAALGLPLVLAAGPNSSSDTV